MPKTKLKLPQKLIHMKNADKSFHESWNLTRDKLNIPHPYRAIISARPNSGKTSVIKNIIVRADPEFDSITVCHCDPDTLEYNDIGAEITTTIPDLESFDRDIKNLLIIDDISFKNLNKEEHENLDRLFGYTSTHRNLSIMLTSQTFHVIPINIRLCANMFILWKSNDMRQMTEIANKIGMDQKKLMSIFHSLKGRSSLWVDGTDNSPYPLRMNGYDMV